MRFSPFILVWICMALKILEFWLIVRLQNDKSWIYCESCLQWKLRQFQSISTLGSVTFCSNREALHKYVRVLKTQFIFIVSNERSKKTYQICSSFSNSFQETKKWIFLQKSDHSIFAFCITGVEQITGKVGVRWIPLLGLSGRSYKGPASAACIPGNPCC